MAIRLGPDAWGRHKTWGYVCGEAPRNHPYDGGPPAGRHRRGLRHLDSRDDYASPSSGSGTVCKRAAGKQRDDDQRHTRHNKAPVSLECAALVQDSKLGVSVVLAMK